MNVSLVLMDEHWTHIHRHDRWRAGGLAGGRAGGVGGGGAGGSGVGGGSAVRFRCRGQRGHGRAALMATVLWARHGQNVANLSQTFSYRVFDGDLTETGREQALRLGAPLRAP